MTARVPLLLNAAKKRRSSPASIAVRPKAKRAAVVKSAPKETTPAPLTESIATHSEMLLMLHQRIDTEAEDITMNPSSYEPSKALPVCASKSGSENMERLIKITELDAPKRLDSTRDSIHSHKKTKTKPARTKDVATLSNNNPQKQKKTAPFSAVKALSDESASQPNTITARARATIWAKIVLQSQAQQSKKRKPIASEPRKKRQKAPITIAISPHQMSNKTIAELALSVPHERSKQRNESFAESHEDTSGYFSKKIRSSFNSARNLESKTSVLAPQVQIVDGKMVVTQTAIDVSVPSEGDGNVESDERIRDRHWDPPIRGKRWGRESTRQFYHILSQVGTNFSMMAVLFPNRTRKELKKKFKHEEKAQPKLIELALQQSAAPIDAEMLHVMSKLLDKDSAAQETEFDKETSSALDLERAESPRSEVTFDSDLSLIQDGEDDEPPSFDFDNKRASF